MVSHRLGVVVLLLWLEISPERGRKGRMGFIHSIGAFKANRTRYDPPMTAGFATPVHVCGCACDTGGEVVCYDIRSVNARV